MRDSATAARLAGVAAILVAAVGIAGAVVASPDFAVTGNALSDLGRPGNPAAAPVTTLFFDGGLVLAGVVGLPFPVVLWRERGHVLQRIAAVPLAVALVGMAGVGLFPAGEPLHFPAAVTLYLGSMVGMALYGAGAALTGARRRGAATVALVVVHVGVWWWWATGGAVTRGGLAVPEILGAAIFGAWVVWTARTGRRAGSAGH